MTDILITSLPETSFGELSQYFTFLGVRNASGVSQYVQIDLAEVTDWAIKSAASNGHLHEATYASAAHHHDGAYASLGHTHGDLHSHANKTILDKVSNPDRVTAAERVNWNSAVSDQHAHANKATLDLIPAYSAGDSGKILKGSGAGLVWGVDAGAGSGIANVVEDPSPQLGGNLDLNQKYIDADVTPNSDHTGQGGFRYEFTAGGAITAAFPVRIKTDGTVAHTDADALSTALIIGLALSTVASNGTVGVLSPFPVVRDDTWNWTVGSPVFPSTTTGSLTQTQPNGANDIIVVAGIATHADRMLLTPGYCYVKHG